MRSQPLTRWSIETPSMPGDMSIFLARTAEASSWALVRHGADAAHLAFAAVLGMPAKDVVVRESAR
jgi:hypothetical protein